MLFGQMEVNTSFGFAQIEENLLTQLAIYPQEKIHLHTDRNFYVPGEKIWFKVYLTDAATHQYPTFSRYVNVELINQNDSLINRVMIRPENEMFYGYLPILNIIPEGNYTLRAYTQNMENSGDDYFFKKNILIAGKREGGENTSPLSERFEGDFDVTFFPEGGNLVEGAFCKVAIKALNPNGYTETISGVIVDESGVEITTVQTVNAGMGAFTSIPNAGKRYYLKCRNSDGLEKQFELPQPDLRARALTVTQRNKRLSVGVRQSAQLPLSPFGGSQGDDFNKTRPSARTSDISLYLLGHCRGQVFHFAAWDKDHEFVVFPEDSLPAGVLQFVLFNEQMNPLSERLVFSKNYDCETVDFHTDKAIYDTRDNVKVSIFTPSLSGRVGERFHLSVAITDDRDLAIDSSTTILSTLLLSSELKGYIENPAWYLQDNTESAIALDYLMLTHGWRRYNIPEVVKGSYETQQIPFQTSQQISGKLQGGIRSRPVPDSEVLIMAKEGDFGLTSTDENGIFFFDNFEYPDSTSYFIQALENNPVELIISEETFPKLIHAPQNFFSRQKTIDSKTIDKEIQDVFITKAEQRSKYDDEMRVITLDEVEVTASRIEKKDESRLQFWANSNSDITIRREEIEKTAPKLVTELLRNVPGLQVFPRGDIRIRGSLYRPLVLIDGVPVYWPDEMISQDQSPLETVSVHDIENIDIIKGIGVAMFGTRGEGGIISITTKRGIDVIREVEKNREQEAHKYITYTPLGYQKPVEFYSPKYETLEAKYLSIPDYRTTIFWKPDIVISKEGEASFEFYTSDFPTTYSVVIEGLTSDGRIIRQVEKIVVSY